MEIKIKVYCLTIKNSPRHNHMIEKLSKISGLDYEFIFANKFDKDFVESIVNKDDVFWHLSQFSEDQGYIEKAYSCADGHRRIMEKFLNNTEGYNWVLVIEDDCVLPDNIIDVCNQIIKKYKYNWYHLATEAYRKYLKNDKSITNDEVYVSHDNVGHSTLCYLVNKNFAIKYYKELTPIKMPSDITLWNYNTKIPIVYNSNVLFDDDQNISTIGIN